MGKGKKIGAGIGIAVAALIGLGAVGASMTNNNQADPSDVQDQANQAAQSNAAPEQPECDPSYPSICISPNSPDLNCDDISARGFTVRSPDPHGFDRDNDGIGCEG